MDAKRGGRPVGSGAIYGEVLASAVCEGLAEGASLSAVCRRPGLPSMTTVQRWLRARPDFAGRVAAARAASGGPHRGGRPSICSPELGEAICEATIAGHGLAEICAWPGFPCVSTFFKWLRRDEAFRDAYALAREIVGHLAYDEVGRVVRGLEPTTAQMARAKILGLQWLAERAAPWAYSARAEAREPVTVIQRHYQVLKEQADGSLKRVPQPGDADYEAYRAAVKARSDAFRAAFAAAKGAVLDGGMQGNAISAMALEAASAALKAIEDAGLTWTPRHETVQGGGASP